MLDPARSSAGTFGAHGFRSGIPYELFQRLRDEDPCHWSEFAGVDGGWNLVRHHDVVAALQDTDLYSSHAGGTTLLDQHHEERLHNASLLHLDPPEHTTVRRRFAAGFRSSAIEGWSGAFAEIAEEVVCGLRDRSEIDLVTDVAGRMVAYALAEVLGIDRSARQLFLRLSALMLGDAVPSPGGVDYLDLARTPGLARAFAGSPSEAMLRLLRDATERPDSQSVLAAASGTAERDIEHLLVILATAGTGMTQNAIVGTLLELLHHDGARWFTEDGEADALDRLVEEGLRFSTPLLHVRRTATRTHHLHGKRVEAGDKVVLWLASANFDERVFPDPLRFDPHRTPNPHVSFGRGGPHFCLGAALARLEMRSLLQTLRRAAVSLELVETPQRLESNFVSEISRMVVRVRWNDSTTCPPGDLAPAWRV